LFLAAALYCLGVALDCLGPDIGCLVAPFSGFTIQELADEILENDCRLRNL